MVFVDEPLQMLAQFPFSKDHESHVGQLLHDEMSGFDEMTLPFVRHERPDSTHNEGMMRKEECLVNVHRRHCDNLLNVDSLVYRDDVRLGYSISHEHRADGVGRRDETVDLSVFPARERVAFEMEINA